VIRFALMVAVDWVVRLLMWVSVIVLSFIVIAGHKAVLWLTDLAAGLN